MSATHKGGKEISKVESILHNLYGAIPKRERVGRIQDKINARHFPAPEGRFAHSEAFERFQHARIETLDEL